MEIGTQLTYEICVSFFNINIRNYLFSDMIYLLKFEKYTGGVGYLKEIIVGFSFVLILASCSNNNEDNAHNKAEEINATTQPSEEQINKLSVQNEELQAALDNIQTDLNYKIEEIEYYKQLINDLIKDYSETELKDLAIKFWDYQLKVNGVSVPPNGTVETKENKIEISLKESQSAFPILPNEIFIKGQISGDYIDHLKMNSIPNETYVTDGTVVTAVHHKFVDVNKGSTITFTVSEELRKRLGLETTQITINKNNIETSK